MPKVTVQLVSCSFKSNGVPWGRGGGTFSSRSGAALVLTDTGEEPHVPLVFYYTDYENQE